MLRPKELGAAPWALGAMRDRMCKQEAGARTRGTALFPAAAMAAGVDNRSSAMATTTGASGDAMAIAERAVARETPHCCAATETLLTRSGRSASCCESISLAELAKSLDRHPADRPSGRDGDLVALRFIRIKPTPQRSPPGHELL
jgi:hypothetical protein